MQENSMEQHQSAKKVANDTKNTTEFHQNRNNTVRRASSALPLWTLCVW